MQHRFQNKRIGKYAARQSSEYVEGKRKRVILAAGLVLVSLVSYSYSFSALLHLPVFNLSTVRVTGIRADLADRLEAAVSSGMAGEKYGFIPRSSSFLYSKGDIVRDVEAAAPSVESVEVNRGGLHDLYISVIEKKATATVCTDLPDFNDLIKESAALDERLSEGVNVSSSTSPATEANADTPSFGKCYFVDGQATVFGEAPVFSTNVYNRYFIPDLDENASTTGILRTKAIPEANFAALQALYQTLKQSKFHILGILVKGGGEYELYTESNKDPMVVYFNDANGFDNEISNFLSFIKFMNDKSKSRGEQISFDSIDLRYGSNVFYRESK